MRSGTEHGKGIVIVEKGDDPFEAFKEVVRFFDKRVGFEVRFE